MLNNAGVTMRKTRIHECTEAEYDFIMGVNAKRVWNGCKQAITQVLRPDYDDAATRKLVEFVTPLRRWLPPGEVAAPACPVKFAPDGAAVRQRLAQEFRLEGARPVYAEQ